MVDTMITVEEEKALSELESIIKEYRRAHAVDDFIKIVNTERNLESALVTALKTVGD